MSASPAEARFERWRNASGFVLAPVGGVLVWLAPLAVTPRAHTLAAIMTAVVVLWITEAIPIPVTALLGAAAAVLLGVGGAKEVFASFAHPIIFLFLGSFLLAEAMTVHGLDRRLAFWVLTRPWVGERPQRILLAIGLLAAGLSLWVSNTATAAMLLPIALGILRALAQAQSDRLHTTVSPASWTFGTGLMLMVAYGASVGGLGTPIGTPPNLIGKGLIADQLGRQIGFGEWMAFGLPIVIVAMIGLYALLVVLHRPDVGSLAGVGSYLAQQRAALGRMSRGERNAAIAFGTAIVLWLLPTGLTLAWGERPITAWYEAHLSESVAALLAAGLLFVLPVDWSSRRFTLTWSEAERIDWGTILLFGGGLALGDLMFKTGLSEAAGRGVSAALQADTLWTITALAIAMGIVLSELTSNTASATMIVPVAMAVAEGAGVSPLPPALGACLGASFGFMLPVSTPPNAIVYGSGLIPIAKMVRAGVLLDIMGFFVLWSGLRLLCPLLGLV